MAYFIFDDDRERSGVASETDTTPDAARLQTLLSTGSPFERRTALRELVARGMEEVLIECLASGDGLTVKLSIAGLWECWLNEAGAEARERMDQGIDAMNDGHVGTALEIFEELAFAYPDWAEPINKQATALYIQGKCEQSIELCREVVARKPDHFGAWNGMALCAIQIDRWQVALEAVQQSLRLQPASASNQHLLRLVESRLTPP